MCRGENCCVWRRHLSASMAALRSGKLVVLSFSPSASFSALASGSHSARITQRALVAMQRAWQLCTQAHLQPPTPQVPAGRQLLALSSQLSALNSRFPILNSLFFLLFLARSAARPDVWLARKLVCEPTCKLACKPANKQTRTTTTTTTTGHTTSIKAIN